MLTKLWNYLFGFDDGIVSTKMVEKYGSYEDIKKADTMNNYSEQYNSSMDKVFNSLHATPAPELQARLDAYKVSKQEDEDATRRRKRQQEADEADRIRRSNDDTTAMLLNQSTLHTTGFYAPSYEPSHSSSDCSSSSSYDSGSSYSSDCSSSSDSSSF